MPTAEALLDRMLNNIDMHGAGNGEVVPVPRITFRI
jgi:hypothetical protein